MTARCVTCPRERVTNALTQCFLRLVPYVDCDTPTAKGLTALAAVNFAALGFGFPALCCWLIWRDKVAGGDTLTVGGELELERDASDSASSSHARSAFDGARRGDSGCGCAGRLVAWMGDRFGDAAHLFVQPARRLPRPWRVAWAGPVGFGRRMALALLVGGYWYPPKDGVQPMLVFAYLLLLLLVQVKALAGPPARLVHCFAFRADSLEPFRVCA
jgi:hypothetical protein